MNIILIGIGIMLCAFSLICILISLFAEERHYWILKPLSLMGWSSWFLTGVILIWKVFYA